MFIFNIASKIDEFMKKKLINEDSTFLPINKYHI